VDAGMRELNATGYMHNRARLITASFLIKTLLINWEDGEKYFSQHLTDYDPASNNGNWQWVASTGADSQPYFRIFNPWSQSEKYDPDANYIKKWIPELKDVPAKAIHTWDAEYEKYAEINYPRPIVNYEEQRKKALTMYKQVV
jgi:deoxyribodipyrimidine photo-lyase